MPKALEDKLEREAATRGYKGKRRNAFIYGTLRSTGWRPKRERKAGRSTNR